MAALPFRRHLVSRIVTGMGDHKEPVSEVPRLLRRPPAPYLVGARASVESGLLRLAPRVAPTGTATASNVDCAKVSSRGRCGRLRPPRPAALRSSDISEFRCQE